MDNAKQIGRLLAFWPQANLSDAVMAAYGEAVAKAHPDDVRSAVNGFLTGKVDRNPAFIPVPGELSVEIAKRRNARLDEEARNKPRLPRSPDQQPLSDDEAKARKAFVADVLKRSGLKRSSDRIPSDPEHEAAKRRTIAEALGMDEATLAAKLAACPDRETARSAA
jgi:hypothetical protein